MSDERREQLHLLMTLVLDDEATEAQRAELEAAAAEDPVLRAEWERQRKVKEVAGTMRFSSPPPEVWDGYWDSVYNRTERRLAWILVAVGTAVLAVWCGWETVQAIVDDQEIPPLVKRSMLALAVGVFLLLFSVMREKLFTARNDPYKDIQR